MINTLAFLLVIALGFVLLFWPSGCASITCPTCSPIVVCEPWINPLGDGGAPGADAGGDAAPVPSGSASP